MTGPARRSSWQLRGAAKYGWRGIYLQAIGIGWILIGVASAVAPSEAHSWVLFDYAPDWLRGLCWFTTGAVAFVVGRRSTDATDDSAGHVALYLVPAARGASYAISWVAWATSAFAHDVIHRDVHVIGWQPALFPTAVWLSIIAFLSICARWPNPTPLPHPPAEGSRHA